LRNALHAGEFMPGHDDDWVVEERARLQDLPEGLPMDAPVVAKPRLARGRCRAKGSRSVLARVLDAGFRPSTGLLIRNEAKPSSSGELPAS
jgi:hypothetical protein